VLTDRPPEIIDRTRLRTPGTVATTTDDAWRSAFESVFLGALKVVLSRTV
jgi:hypothetical protein